MKRVAAAAGGGGEKHLVDMQTTLFRGHLALLEHLAFLRYDDDTEREPGWLTLATRGAAWRLTVKDPDSACSFSTVAATVDQAWDTACLMLACGEAPWERDPFLAGQQKKKKK